VKGNGTSAEPVIELHGVSHAGLTASEAEARLATEGPNVLVAPKRRSSWRQVVGPLADPMVALLVVAGLTYLTIGERRDGIVALAAVFPVAAVGWLLETRASRALHALERMTAQTARVLRDGVWCTTVATGLVVGDVIALREGDVVPADGRVIELTQLAVNEAALTGESLPSEKTTSTGEDEVLAGTHVVSGSAVVRVERTGPRTRYGELARLVSEASVTATPLQRSISRLLRLLIVGAAALCIAVAGVEVLRGHGIAHGVLAGVSLAIAAMPEEFPLVYSLYLGLGAWRLARQNALVRRLPGVETLGSTTVICTDKTGTLTEGRISIAEIHACPGWTRQQVVDVAMLASERNPFDPIDIAIAAQAEPLPDAELLIDHPFDPVRRHVTHVWRIDGSLVVAAKGAFEGVVGNAAGSDALRGLVAAHDRLTRHGLRVITVATGTPRSDPPGDRLSDEAGLEIVGLIAFSDPIRAGVVDAVAECRRAGVRVVLITGDHPATALAVAEQLELSNRVGARDAVVTGDDIDAASPAELDQLVARANVFARTRPDQKYLIVQALRRQGEIVAMTGDGINDAPALREADIGVAMGERGTEVARQSATIVLLDDNFATIVSAIRNGRRILDNISHAFSYLLAFHPPLLVAAIAIPIADKPLLLQPIHLVALEIVLHPIISVVFEGDDGEDLMGRPPVAPAEALAPRRLRLPLAVGATVAASFVVLYLSMLARGWPITEARGLAFAFLLVAQLPLILSNRVPDHALSPHHLDLTRRVAFVAVGLGAGTLCTLYWPPLAETLQLTPFPLVAWPLVVALAVVTSLWAEPLKGRCSRVSPTRNHPRRTPAGRRRP